jgi:hypothetical protein
LVRQPALAIGARLRGLPRLEVRVHRIEGPALLEFLGLAELVAGERRGIRDRAPALGGRRPLQQPRGRIVSQHARLAAVASHHHH